MAMLTTEGYSMMVYYKKRFIKDGGKVGGGGEGIVLEVEGTYLGGKVNKCRIDDTVIHVAIEGCIRKECHRGKML